MAIKYQNKYLKIVEIVHNVDENQSYVIVKRYVSEEERIREKRLWPLFDAFRKNAEKYIIETRAKIDEYIPDDLTEDMIDSFLTANPDLKQQLDEWDSFSNEYFSIMHNVLYEYIEESCVKHLDLWLSLGFTKEMFKYIVFERHTKLYPLTAQLNSLNVSEAYDVLKELLSNSEDC